MKQTTVQRLNALNQSFYDQVSTSFDQTRRQGWAGWHDLVPHISRFKEPNLLDLGCGNGRFLDFICAQNLAFETYLGLDNSDHLLGLARMRFGHMPNAKFLKHDLLKPLKLKVRFDLITLFGVMHHLPGKLSRQKLLSEVGNHLRPDGLIVFSVWNFLVSRRLKAKLVDPSTIEGLDESDLDSGDFFLPWQDKSAVRYCHSYTDDEILSLLESANLKLVEKLTSPGDNDQLNTYYLVRKLT